MPTKRRPRGSGSVRQLPSGAYQARFSYGGRNASRTMDSKAAAQGWLKKQTDAVTEGVWQPPSPVIEPVPAESVAPLFRDYAKEWLAERGLKPRTVEGYQRMLDRHLLPKFGRRQLDSITVAEVKAWHRTLLPENPTMRTHIYGLLRTILNTAFQDDLIPANPCRIRGAGNVSRQSKTEIPTAEQVRQLADEMGITRNNDKSTRVLADGKYKVMTLVAAWCGLRYGEITELRRKDIVFQTPEATEDDPQPRAVPVMVKVRRGVVRVGGAFVVGEPKSEAGVRDVVIPPHIRDDFAEYLATLPAGAEVLVFPGSRNGVHMAPASLYKPWYRARDNVGLPTLRWHDLRHFAGTTAAQTGATLAEIQGRLGHSTVQAAMRYQHAASGRDAEIAYAMSKVAMRGKSA